MTSSRAPNFWPHHLIWPWKWPFWRCSDPFMTGITSYEVLWYTTHTRLLHILTPWCTSMDWGKVMCCVTIVIMVITWSHLLFALVEECWIPWYQGVQKRGLPLEMSSTRYEVVWSDHLSQEMVRPSDHLIWSPPLPDRRYDPAIPHTMYLSDHLSWQLPSDEVVWVDGHAPLPRVHYTTC